MSPAKPKDPPRGRVYYALYDSPTNDFAAWSFVERRGPDTNARDVARWVGSAPARRYRSAFLMADNYGFVPFARSHDPNGTRRASAALPMPWEA